MFSSRLPSRIGTNAVTAALAVVRASGRAILDLTQTNPTLVGLQYPDNEVRGGVGPVTASYEPEPFGLASARAAVAAEMGRAEPDRVMLTASTSEAYAFLFKLLCDPGDDVLVPRPSYPLFDLLTELEGVRPVAYQLDPHGGWCLDRGTLEQALSDRTAAILVVSPNNPTGSVVGRADREWLVDLAADRGIAIIADEVFAPYPLGSQPAASFAGEDGALVFTLGGLSKSAGLPGMKLAWTLVSGPEDVVDDALLRLAIIADTYLSVSTPVQQAAAQLIAAGAARRRVIAARLADNLVTLQALVAAAPSLSLIEPDGGWSAVVRVPAILSEEELVIRLITQAGVLVHPGYFFDFPGEAYLVLSLLPAPAVFREGATRIAERVGTEARP